MIKNISSTIWLALAVVTVMIVSVILYTGSPVNRSVAEHKTASEYTQEAWQSVEDGYNLSYTENLFKSALKVDPNNEQALYSLARIYYIKGDYRASFATIETYKELYPTNKRIHYIAGLAHGFAGDLTVAANELRAFIDSGLSTWRGYLDLAWVLFKQGEYIAAQDALETAIVEFGGNVWLNTSMGAVKVALGENESARIYLEQADTQVGELSVGEWQQNYSFNNKDAVLSGIDNMKGVIGHNLSLAKGEYPDTVATLLKAPFAGLSPDGVAKGIVVSACGDSCSASACQSAVNVCGDFNTGTRNSCTGNTCSASQPANPDPEINCTVQTACGPAQGSLGCNGRCNLSAYPICPGLSDPEGTSSTTPTGATLTGGEVLWFPPVDQPGGVVGATTITANIGASPLLVSLGSSTVVVWHSTETKSCDITSTGADEWLKQDIYGNELSSAVTSEVTYTLVCTGYDGTTATDAVTVKILPTWNEQ